MPLVDAYGRTLSSFPAQPPLGGPPFVPVRFTDTWGRYVSKNLTPETLATVLKEADQGYPARQAELAMEMEEKDPDLSSVLHTRKLAVQGLSWEILPASESPEDQDIAAFIEERLRDLDIEDPTLDLMDAVFKGYSLLWIVWDQDARGIYPSALQWVPPWRCTFVEGTSWQDAPFPEIPRLLTDREPQYGEPIEPFTAIYHRYKARSGIAPRGGLLRPCAYPYVFRNYGWKDFLIFCEKYGQPTRVGTFKAGALPEDIAILKMAVDQLGVDAGAAISDNMKIELLAGQSTAASTDLYLSLITEVNKEYAKCVLGQTATTEGTPGKLGNDQERGEVRHDILEADARSLAKTWRQQLIWPLVRWNFGDKSLPQFKYHSEQSEDLEMLSRTHGALHDMGMPLPLSYMRKTYNVPEPVAGEEVLSSVPPPPAFGGPEFDLLAKKKIPIGSRSVRYGT